MTCIRWQSYGDDAAKVFRTRGLFMMCYNIILWWWVRCGERKISIFILFTFLGTVCCTRQGESACTKTIRWQRTLCCSTRPLLHARDVILPFVYNYSKTISFVCNNNIIFSAVKIISEECIACRSVPAASPPVRVWQAFGQRRHTRVYINRMILYILSDEDDLLFFLYEINIRLPIATRLRI